RYRPRATAGAEKRYSHGCRRRCTWQRGSRGRRRMMTATTRHAESALRIILILIGLFLVLSGFLPLYRAFAASSDVEIQVRINAAQIAPRPLEEVVGRAIVQQYSRAWKNLETALDQNNTDLLNESFIGYAQDKLNAQIAAQKKNSLSTRYIDHGHQVDAILYSRDGSAVEMRDTAQLEIQYLDGSKVVTSEKATRHYVAVITLVDDRWKVRVLDSAPGF